MTSTQTLHPFEDPTPRQIHRQSGLRSPIALSPAVSTWDEKGEAIVYSELELALPSLHHTRTHMHSRAKLKPALLVARQVAKLILPETKCLALDLGWSIERTLFI